MAVPQCPGSFAHIHTGKALNGSLSILAEHVCDPKHNRMGGLKRAAMRPLPPAYLLKRLSWDSFSSAPGFWWGMGLSATPHPRAELQILQNHVAAVYICHLFSAQLSLFNHQNPYLAGSGSREEWVLFVLGYPLLSIWTTGLKAR